MDDDIAAWILFFLIIMASIVGATAAFVGGKELTKPPPPHVSLLQSPNLVHRQTLATPLVLSGTLTGYWNTIFYVCNDESFNQTVSFEYGWLDSEIRPFDIYIDFYCSAGYNFTVPTAKTQADLVECQITFSLNASTPMDVAASLQNRTIYLDVKSSGV